MGLVGYGVHATATGQQEPHDKPKGVRGFVRTLLIQSVYLALSRSDTQAQQKTCPTAYHALPTLVGRHAIDCKHHKDSVTRLVIQS